MSAIDLDKEPCKTNRAWKPEDKRYAFPAPSEVHRFFTVWSWREGPVERDERYKRCRYFWEQLHSNAPVTASPYCCYLNTVIFHKSENDYTEICREDTYGFNNASPTLLTDPTAREGEPIFYEVATGRVIYRDDRWWMRWIAWSNTRIARMLNDGWPHQ